MPNHSIEHLILLFNQTFQSSHQTRLICCEAEPIYRPADEQTPYHRIIFAHGFFASALHEISHWCIAGPQRRLQEDFGYWYQPDGRTAEQQALFEKVEVKPQALEWIFSVACQFEFHFSADNLEGHCGPSDHFKQAVQQQVKDYLTQGLPEEANLWCQTLKEFYRAGHPLELSEFT